MEPILGLAIEHLSPIASSFVTALATWQIANRRTAQQSKQFDLNYVRSLVDEHLDELKQDRARLLAELDRNQDEIIKLRERIAVLESRSAEAERQYKAAIVRLQRENEELRKINQQMAIELRKLQSR